MPTTTYERYGLTGNPFRDLASENLENVTIYHVNQDVDDTLRTIKDEVFDKENRAVVAIIGELGAGKTERLLVTLAEAKERSAFSVYFDVTTKTQWVLQGLAQEFTQAAKAAKLVKMFGAPAWLRPVARLARIKDEKYDPKAAGRALGAALNGAAPSFLLLNDVHNLIESKEANSFARVLQELTDVVKPGVLVMFTCYSSYLAWLTVNFPALASRINRTFLLKNLTDDEAAAILAKKLLVKRVVEDLDPIYPFDRDAVRQLNAVAKGNPRRLLEFADLAIEYGIAHRAYRVDSEVIQAILVERRATEIPSLARRPAPSSNALPPSNATSSSSAAAAPGPEPAPTAKRTPAAVPASPSAPWVESK